MSLIVVPIRYMEHIAHIKTAESYTLKASVAMQEAKEGQEGQDSSKSVFLMCFIMETLINQNEWKFVKIIET